jgi:4-hydroxybenzoate polyprenyltransferase/phosphoserine phosphatase
MQSPEQTETLAESPSATSSVLCVDLDGTLLKGDLLWESLLLLLKRRPLSLLRLPAWIIRGKAYTKRQIALRVVPNAATLNYHPQVLDLIREARKQNRRVALVTASDAIAVEPIRDHFGMFTDFMASDGITNLSGAEKCRALVSRFGEQGFDYIGDSLRDLPVWKEAQTAILVEPSASLKRRAGGVAKSVRTIESDKRSLADMWRALRPHQWLKNVLVFVPLAISHRPLDVGIVEHIFLAFIEFCLCASAAYLLNDLLDIEADRKHHKKRKRPIAAGKVSIPTALGAALTLLLLSFGLAGLTASAAAIALLLLYLVVTTAYSLSLKKIAILDVVTLSGLYTLRIFFGAVSVSVPVSAWLLAFSVFFFMSLAMAKRFSELVRSAQDESQEVAGRGYRPGDRLIVANLGAASGYVSVLVMALYVNSHEVVVLYQRPQLLWLMCPILLYWVSRLWLIAYRGELGSDPVIYALEDRVSYMLGAVTLLVILLATTKTIPFLKL